MPLPLLLTMPSFWQAAGGALQGTLGWLAGRRQNKATDQAIALEKDNELRRRQEFDIMLAEERKRWESREAALAPYRQAALLTLRDLAKQRGRPLTGTGGTGGTLGSLVGR